MLGLQSQIGRMQNVLSEIYEQVSSTPGPKQVEEKQPSPLPPTQYISAPLDKQTITELVHEWDNEIEPRLGVSGKDRSWAPLNQNNKHSDKSRQSRKRAVYTEDGLKCAASQLKRQSH